AALCVSACGGAPSPTLSRLRAQATRICRVADRATDQIQAPTTPSGGLAFLRSGLAVLAPELTRLRALRAPADTSDVFRAAISAFAGEVTAVRQTVSALDAGQDPALAMRQLERRLSPLENQQDGAWQALGVSACATH
ncbi:MAG: hypothetical protein JO243_05695, partial [Solirubrobacterales bacterium]|nr:hypothetical protein [Solirubrobacterales bacterium]